MNDRALTTEVLHQHIKADGSKGLGGVILGAFLIIKKGFGYFLHNKLNQICYLIIYI